MPSDLTTDFRVVTDNLLPNFMRQPVNTSFAKVQAKLLNDKNEELTTFQDVNFSGQTADGSTVGLEAFLNKHHGLPYDSTFSGRSAAISAKTTIWIETVDRLDTYLFRQVENKDVTLYKNPSEGTTIYLFTAAELATSTNDFNVYIPLSQSGTTGLHPHTGSTAINFRALIDQYRWAGKTYNVIEY